MTALLFDQNISPKLIQRLGDIFPASVHVSQIGLAEALDRTVWEYARTNNLVLVSKDADFSELGLLLVLQRHLVLLRHFASTRDKALLAKLFDNMLAMRKISRMIATLPIMQDG